MTTETPSSAWQRLAAFDRALAVGQLVQVRWTNSHRFFVATGRVSKLNVKSVRVALAENIYNYDLRDGKLVEGCLAYAKGREIIAPRLLGQGQSPNNGVFALPEAVVDIIVDGCASPVMRLEFRGEDALAEAQAKAAELQRRYQEGGRTNYEARAASFTFEEAR